MHVRRVKIEKTLYKRLPENKTSICLTDKLLIALYMALKLSRWLVRYFLVLKPGRKYALISQYALKSNAGALKNPRLW